MVVITAFIHFCMEHILCFFFLLNYFFPEKILIPFLGKRWTFVQHGCLLVLRVDSSDIPSLSLFKHDCALYLVEAGNTGSMVALWPQAVDNVTVPVLLLHQWQWPEWQPNRQRGIEKEVRGRVWSLRRTFSTRLISVDGLLRNSSLGLGSQEPPAFEGLFDWDASVFCLRGKTLTLDMLPNK